MEATSLKTSAVESAEACRPEGMESGWLCHWYRHIALLPWKFRFFRLFQVWLKCNILIFLLVMALIFSCSKWIWQLFFLTVSKVLLLGSLLSAHIFTIAELAKVDSKSFLFIILTYFRFFIMIIFYLLLRLSQQSRHFLLGT